MGNILEVVRGAEGDSLRRKKGELSLLGGRELNGRKMGAF